MAERGAIADNTLTPIPSKRVSSRPTTPLSFSNKRHDVGSSGITKEVALKMIPKKKVKGNEASVWSEMEVLKGLDHPNIVRPTMHYS